MKNELREWGLILVKTGIVTLLIALGVTLHDLMHLPGWAVGLGLIPAGYALCKLLGMEVPSVRRWGPQLLGIMFLTFLFEKAVLHLDGVYRVGAVVILVVAFSFMRLIPEWPTRRSGH